jgi:Tfp pilus assembly protein FimT
MVKQHAGRRDFTLIELLVVIAINRATWWALGTMANGEVISSDGY